MAEGEGNQVVTSTENDAAPETKPVKESKTKTIMAEVESVEKTVEAKVSEVEVRIKAAIDRWAQTHLHNSPLSRSTMVWNFFQNKLEALITEIMKEV